MMVELTARSIAVIHALLGAPVAWQTPAELSRALGWDSEETTDHVAALDAGGWLAAWEGEGDGGPVVTLSVEAAARLDARLVERGPEAMPRWAARDQPEPAAPRAPGVFRSERAASLDLVIDPRMTPEAAMEAAELAAGLMPAPDADSPARAARIAVLPGPILFLGTGTSPWPGPGRGRAEGRCCPVCGDRPLGPATYCLSCDRWGLDHRLAFDVEPAPPARIAALRDQGHVQRRREAEARARKAKRRARMAAVEAARKGKKAAKAKGWPS